MKLKLYGYHYKTYPVVTIAMLPTVNRSPLVGCLTAAGIAAEGVAVGVAAGSAGTEVWRRGTSCMEKRQHMR